MCSFLCLWNLRRSLGPFTAETLSITLFTEGVGRETEGHFHLRNSDTLALQFLRALQPCVSGGPEALHPTCQACKPLCLVLSFPILSGSISLLPSLKKHWHVPAAQLCILPAHNYYYKIVPFPDKESYFMKRNLGTSH